MAKIEDFSQTLEDLSRALANNTKARAALGAMDELVKKGITNDDRQAADFWVAFGVVKSALAGIGIKTDALPDAPTGLGEIKAKEPIDVTKALAALMQEEHIKAAAGGIKDKGSLVANFGPNDPVKS